MYFKVCEEYILEEFMSGLEFSVEFFLSNNEIVFVEVIEKYMIKLLYFVELMYVFLIIVDVVYKKEIINMVYCVVRVLGFYNGLIYVEVKLIDVGVCVVEVNGCFGGDNIIFDLIKDVYGIDIFKKIVEFYLNKIVMIKLIWYGVVVISFLFVNSKGSFELV